MPWVSAMVVPDLVAVGGLNYAALLHGLVLHAKMLSCLADCSMASSPHLPVNSTSGSLHGIHASLWLTIGCQESPQPYHKKSCQCEEDELGQRVGWGGAKVMLCLFPNFFQLLLVCSLHTNNRNI